MRVVFGNVLVDELGFKYRILYTRRYICISKENIQSLDSQFCRFTYLLHHHHVYYLIVFALVFFYYFSSLFMDELMQYESDVFAIKVFESTFSYGWYVISKAMARSTWSTWEKRTFIFFLARFIITGYQKHSIYVCVLVYKLYKSEKR